MISTLKKIFSIKRFHLPAGKADPVPLVIIKKNSENANVKEFTSIEEAIADLESEPNVPSYKIEKLRASLENLKNKTSIRIRNGEIIS